MTLLVANNVVVEYQRGGRTIRAVDKVSLEVEKGTMLGVVGESGSGKSTLALSILGLLPRNGRVVEGSIDFGGTRLTDLSEAEWLGVRGRRIGMVFQGAMNSLNPVRRVIDQVVEPIKAHQPQTRKAGAIDRASELLTLVGIPTERHNAFPHEFSGGMRQRVGIALALSAQPEMLIADEPVTALDVIVQAQILSLFEKLRTVLGLTVIFITHDLGVVAKICDHVVVMYAARGVEEGTVAEIYDDPKHPYTKLLLESVPSLSRARGQSRGIPGVGASLLDPPAGCRFHPRCPYSMEVCSTVNPLRTRFTKDQAASCHLYDEGTTGIG